MSNIGNLSRRDFFKLAMGGAVIAATTSPSLASIFQQSYAEKIKQLIRLHTEVVEEHERINKGISQGRQKEIPMEKVFSYMLENFRIPERDTAEFVAARDAIKYKVFDTMDFQADSWREVPPVLPEAGVVCAVAKDLISVRRIPFNPATTPSFEAFAVQYQYLILV